MNLSKEMSYCYEQCSATAKLCVEMVKYGLEKGGEAADSRLIVKLFDCAQMCRSCREACEAGPSKSSAARQACARYCDECAMACEKTSDEKMLACAKQLRKCAEACREEAKVEANA